MVTICTARFSFNLSMFCSHNVFNYFVRIWEIQQIFHYTALTDFFIWQRFHFLKCGDHYLYSQIIINISNFCPLIVYLGNVRIWEQTAFISLHNINWQVYITEMSPSKEQRSQYLQKCFHSKFLRPFHTLNLCVFYESEKKRRIFPYWTLTGLYNRHFTIWSLVVTLCTARI